MHRDKSDRLVTREQAARYLALPDQGQLRGMTDDPGPGFLANGIPTRVAAAKTLHWACAERYARYDGEPGAFAESIQPLLQRASSLRAHAPYAGSDFFEAFDTPQGFTEWLVSTSPAAPTFWRNVARRINMHPWYAPRATRAIQAGLLPAIPETSVPQLVEDATSALTETGILAWLRKHNSYTDDPESVLVWDERALFEMENNWNCTDDTAVLAVEWVGHWFRFWPRDRQSSTYRFLVWLYDDGEWKMKLREFPYA